MQHSTSLEIRGGIMEELLKKVETQITNLIGGNGVKQDNVDYLYKLVDIHKDIKNEEYWKKKEEKYNEEIQRRIQRLWKNER